MNHAETLAWHCPVTVREKEYKGDKGGTFISVAYTMALQLQLCLVIILSFSFSSFISSHPLSHTSNGLRDCRKNTTIPALEVLPGGGWDNLRNLDMGRVMNFSYSQCQTTEDGVYLIPDEVFVIPQKVSGVETNSDIITSWLDQRSTTYYPYLNARFSVENQRMKTHQVRDTAVTAHVQVGMCYGPSGQFNGKCK